MAAATNTPSRAPAQTPKLAPNPTPARAPTAHGTTPVPVKESGRGGIGFWIVALLVVFSFWISL